MSVGLLLAAGLILCGHFALSVLTVQVGDRFTWQSYVNLSKDIFSGEFLAEDLSVSDMSREDADRQQEAELSEIYEALLLERREPERMYTQDAVQELMLYAAIREEIGQTAGYSDYLDSIQQEYERSLSVSIFQSSDSSSKNAKKTAEDFAGMSDTRVLFAGSHGIELLFDTGLMDLILAAVVFILVDALLSGEIGEKRLKLLLCTWRGRGNLAYAKYIFGLLVLTVFFLICALFRIGLIAATYGIPKGAVQSVVGCQSCVLGIGIPEGIAVFFLLKLLVLGSIYSLVFILMLILRNGKFLYFLGVGAGIVSLLCYKKISSNGYLAILKWLNPAAFLDTGNVLFEYRNLILGGNPVSYLQIVLIIAVCLFLAMTIMIGKLFLRAGADREKGFGVNLYYHLEQTIAFLTGKNLTGGFEFRKWFFYQKGMFAVVILIAAASVMYSPAATRLYTDEEIYYKQYMNRLEGSFSEEKMRILYEERVYLEEISEKITEAALEGKSMTATGYQDELRRQEGLEKAIAYGEYLRTTDEGSFVYEKGYLLLLGQGDGKFSLFCYRILSVLAMTMVSILIWGMDEESGMNRIITATDVGMRAVNRKKMIQVLIAGGIVFGIVYLPWIYSVYVSFPEMRGYYTASSLILFAGMPEWITIGAVLALFYLVHLAVLILLGFFGRILYGIWKRSLPAALILFGSGLLAALI